MSSRPSLKGPALLAVLLLSIAGCTHVAPYEREHLAKPGMDAQREGQRARFQAHVYEAREGAMPGGEHAGGGCGCN